MVIYRVRRIKTDGQTITKSTSLFSGILLSCFFGLDGLFADSFDEDVREDAP